MKKNYVIFIDGTKPRSNDKALPDYKIQSLGAVIDETVLLNGDVEFKPFPYPKKKDTEKNTHWYHNKQMKLEKREVFIQDDVNSRYNVTVHLYLTTNLQGD